MTNSQAERIEILVETAVSAANPGLLLEKHLVTDDSGLHIRGNRYGPGTEIILVSVGKAAVSMAQTAVNVLGPAIKAGVVIAKTAEAPDLPRPIQYYQGSHPVPDQRSLNATDALKSLLSQTKPNQLVLCLISGGASALLTRPTLPLHHWQALNEALLASGCTINSINTVRQLFDEVKGGGLARWAAPAACETLILSDVIGNRLEHIGSGPTVFVEKKPEVVEAILDDHRVWDWLEQETAVLLKQQLNLPLPALEKPSTNVPVIIGDVSTATAAAASRAAEWGLNVRVESNSLTGEAREIGRMAAARARELPLNSVLIWGGESTVTLTGDGKGGRNQEMALSAALEIAGLENIILAAFSTDAEDGPLPVAGAFVTGETAVLAQQKGLDPAQYLAHNDSYTFFEKLGVGHLTAERGTNVNDVLIVLKSKSLQRRSAIWQIA